MVKWISRLASDQVFWVRILTRAQKIYDLETFFELSEDAGFYTEHCYSGFTFKDANPDSERAQFVMRKAN